MSKGFLRDLLKYLPAQIAPGIIGLVSIPVVTRLFPPGEYGLYNLAMATVIILSTLLGWLPMSIIRYYPAYAREGRLDVFNGTMVTLTVVMLAVLTTLYYAILLATGAWIPHELRHLLMFGGILFIVTCVFTLLQHFLRSRRLAGRYSGFAVWQSAAGFGLGITLIFLLGTGIEGLLLGSILSTTLVLPLLWRQVAAGDTPLHLRKIDLHAARISFAYGFPLVAGNLAAWVLSLSDRYMLEFFRNSYEVGVYSMSYNIADKSLALVTTLFWMAAGPIGMDLWENSGEHDSRQFVTDVTRLYLWACVPIVVGLSVLSKLVVAILAGSEYADGHKVMPYVLSGVLLLGIQQRYQSGLLFHQKTGLITLATVAAGLLNVVLNIFLIPRYGYFAAAITTLASYAVLLLLMMWFSRRLFVWKFPYRSLLNVSIASAVMGTIVHLLAQSSVLTPASTLAICVCAGAAVYFLLLLVLGEFSLQEFQAILAGHARGGGDHAESGEYRRGPMMTGRLLLLMGFAEEDTKMASVRWRRFRKYLRRDGVDLEWATVRLPYCDESASAAAKAAGEFRVFRHARTLARQLAKDQDPETGTVVLTSIPTLDPLYVGAMLKRLSGSNVELVLEIRDVYARPEIYEYSALRRRLEILKEATLVRYADKVIYLTEEIRRRYRTYYPHLPGIQKGVVITNGYDPEEYGPGPQAPGQDGLLEISYFGSFYGTRNPDLLFQTLHRLKKSDPRRIAIARVHIWGELGNYPLHEKTRQYDLQDTVLYHGIASHDRIMKEYSAAGVNLIITHTTGSSYALPGKLFECMGAARPVWAITDDQILRDLIARHHLGYLSSHEIGSIESTLCAILRDHTSAGRLPNIDPPEDFAVGSLAQELESFLMNGRHDA